MKQFLERISLTPGQFGFLFTQLVVLLTWGIRQDLILGHLAEDVKNMVTSVDENKAIINTLNTRIAVTESRVLAIERYQRGGGVEGLSFIPTPLPWDILSTPLQPLPFSLLASLLER